MNNRGNFEAVRHARRITEQAAAWYLDMHDTPDDRQKAAFLAWLRASPAHVAEYLAMAQMHGDLEAAASLESLTTGELVERAGRADPIVMFPRVGHRDTMDHATTPSRKGRMWRALGAAAAAAAMVLALLGGMHWRETRMEIRQSYSAGSDALRSLKLPDGTLVQLARDSAINVHFDVSLRRIDVVRGHALFDVGRDPSRPLLVNVGDHTLQDIGTVFDVRRDVAGDTLTVINGRVRVWNGLHAWSDEQRAFLDDLKVNGEAVADLTAGQQVTLKAASVGDVQVAAIGKVTAWLPTDIHFQHETVGEVARRFNAYTTIPLVIEDARVAEMRISGVFHANNPQAFATYLSTLPGVRVVQGGDRVSIIASSSHGNDRTGRL